MPKTELLTKLNLRAHFLCIGPHIYREPLDYLDELRFEIRFRPSITIDHQRHIISHTHPIDLTSSHIHTAEKNMYDKRWKKSGNARNYFRLG
jgi:hypothetical protein